MNSTQTFISIQAIQDYFKTKCLENNIEYSENEFQKFIECCEKDFYQWLNDNFKFFSSQS